jgi:Oxidoreductase molybdopterin binding domain
LTLITPNELFFVRNHLPVPKLDEEHFRLEVEGLGAEGPVELTMDDIKNKIPKTSIVSVVQVRSLYSFHYIAFILLVNLDYSSQPGVIFLTIYFLHNV